MMKMPDLLTHALQWDHTTHLPVHVESISPDLRKGRLWWTIKLCTEVGKDDPLPVLPKAMASERAKVIIARRGGAVLESKVKQFTRMGRLRLVGLEDGERADAESYPAAPTEIRLVLLKAFEDTVQLHYTVVCAIPPEHCPELVALLKCDAAVDFELDAAQPRIELFDGAQGDMFEPAPEPIEEFDMMPPEPGESTAAPAEPSVDGETHGEGGRPARRGQRRTGSPKPQDKQTPTSNPEATP